MDPARDKYGKMRIAMIGYMNAMLRITSENVLKNIKKVQKDNGFSETSKKLDGQYNLTVEMETGTGKTYTYIKTMYELNKAYGWNKFIIVVPSVAIREGVYKSFQMTEDHFMSDYAQKIRYFIYNSKQLQKIEQFASDSNINCMIINSQAFNARGQDARRIYMELDEFQSRRPIDVLAKTNPIMIIDEPQSVEGEKTKASLKLFNPLFTLRYSATHKEEYNKIYRLDALDAYNMKLVKKIAVKGISVNGSTGASSYLYFEGVQLRGSKKPVARLEYEHKVASNVKKKLRIVNEGDNLFELSGELAEYKGFVVSEINGANNSISFTNGVTLFADESFGDLAEADLRRIQIRETIRSHLEKESTLFDDGIKVLSLFFIDEVAKYKVYEKGVEGNGIYADVFEREYQAIFDEMKTEGYFSSEFIDYAAVNPKDTHRGYFAIDKEKHLVNPILKAGVESSEDISAYDLIMKNKEQLLSFDEPTRFIFSHSALKEGWDNPNVFQICTLKQSGSDTRKRQEVGRGMRLCVNNRGERIDANFPGVDVHNVNLLTVIASESYEDFAKTLQSEIASSLSSRPKKADVDFFLNKDLVDEKGQQLTINASIAAKIHYALIKSDYVDEENHLTEQYFNDLEAETVVVPPVITGFEQSFIELVSTIYSEHDIRQFENDRKNNVSDLKLNDNFRKTEFQELWKQINRKSVYRVSFKSEELVKNAIAEINKSLIVKAITFDITYAELSSKALQSDYETGNAFHVLENTSGRLDRTEHFPVKYDLVGQIAERTKLTRKTVIAILQGILEEKFNLFKKNPESFIARISKIINEQKATMIIQQITYNPLDEEFSTSIFTQNNLRGKLGDNAVELKKHIFNFVITDSTTERTFAKKLDIENAVEVFAKLPRGFFISTPVGNYNPDWAIVFKDSEDVKTVYFIAETKGDSASLQLKGVENAKIECARKHFEAISNSSVKYDAVASYDELYDKVFGG